MDQMFDDGVGRMSVNFCMIIENNAVSEHGGCDGLDVFK